MDQWMWYLVRSSGIVATALMVAALGWGFLFSARETGKRLRPAWWLDLHNWLGGLALVFTGVHMAAVFADSDLGLGLVDIFVPNAADDQTAAITWGVIAFYLLAVVVFTSWPKKRLRRPVWRAIHLLSVPATIFAGIHAYTTGSDATTFAFKAFLVLLAGAAVYPAALRLTGVISSRMASRRAA
jgi:DMSO/TMAO reductase YedYZ heme-binding membrane subunit